VLHEGNEFVSVIGIFLEILGFILMIRLFNKAPMKADVDNFNNKHRKRIEGKYPFYIPNKNVFLREVLRDVYSGMSVSCSEAFLHHWSFKTKSLPLLLVIGGLFLQIIQLFIN